MKQKGMQSAAGSGYAPVGMGECRPGRYPILQIGGFPVRFRLLKGNESGQGTSYFLAWGAG